MKISISKILSTFVDYIQMKQTSVSVHKGKECYLLNYFVSGKAMIWQMIC